MDILTPEYFRHEDTLWLAKDLLGKILVTRFTEGFTCGRIVETEAYLGQTDRACHAYGGRRTARTEPMYLPGGYAYVYLCYGIHHLFNIVTHRQDMPHAILIRALEPLMGMDVMMQRRKKHKPDASLTRGPGSLSKALGLHTRHSGTLLKPSCGIYLAEDGITYPENLIGCGPRIGVDYAGEDARLACRFYLRGNPGVSKPNL